MLLQWFIKDMMLFFLSIVSYFLFAQESLDEEVIFRIKAVGFQKSRVMETLVYMSDVYGPRLSGSPDFREAADWAKNRFEEFGLENVHFDSYADDLRGWGIDSYSIEMIEPRYMSIVGLPSAWTRSTKGEITGIPIIVDYDNYEDLNQLKGQLTGRILIKPIDKVEKQNRERTGPFTDAELDNAARHTDANNKDGLDNSGIKPFIERLKLDQYLVDTEADRVQKFMLSEGVAAVIRPSILNYGLIDAQQLRYTKKNQIKPIPHFVIAKEQHGRIIRMLDMGSQPYLKLNLESTFYSDPEYHVNLIGEIPGTDKGLKDEIVMVGGHFDSYHSGTGAADNGAGCATILEAVRILKEIGIEPRRTIRIAFWGGEEQGLNGSMGYVKKYVGDILQGTKKPEQSKISVYFNHDNNGHNIRGIFTQGNEAIRPIFDKYLEPFHHLGAKTTTIENACCTDHRPFDAMNIPSFEWIQDPMEYFTHQIHTSMDVLDLVREESLKRNAVIIATFIYHAAMRDEMMPRKKL